MNGFVEIVNNERRKLLLQVSKIIAVEEIVGSSSCNTKIYIDNYTIKSFENYNQVTQKIKNCD